MLEYPEFKADAASVRTSFIYVCESDDIVSLNKCLLRGQSLLQCMIELSVLGIESVFFCCFCVLLATCVTPSRHTSDLCWAGL